MADDRQSRRVRLSATSPGASRAWLVVSVAALTLGVDVVGAHVGLPDLAYALAVPAAILVGVPGAVGFALGGLLAAAWSGSTVSVTVALLIGDLVLVALVLLGWLNGPVPRPGGRVPAALSRAAGVLRVATVALLASVGVTAVGLDVVGAVPVAAAVPVMLADRAPGVLAGVVLVLATRRGGLASPKRGDPTTAPGPAVRAAPLVVALGWLLGALALGLVRQDLAALPGARAEFVATLPATVSPFALPLVGAYYHPVQVAAAVIAVATVTRLLAGQDTRTAVRSLGKGGIT